MEGSSAEGVGGSDPVPGIGKSGRLGSRFFELTSIKMIRPKSKRLRKPLQTTLMRLDRISSLNDCKMLSVGVRRADTYF